MASVRDMPAALNLPHENHSMKAVDGHAPSTAFDPQLQAGNKQAPATCNLRITTGATEWYGRISGKRT